MASCIDYGQTADDHQSILVLVRHTGSQLPVQSFNRAFDKISRVDRIYVQGQKRNISVKYKKYYPVESNSWGDFQSHRKVLGLVTIGKCIDHDEFGDLFTSYKSIKEEYASSIINSRLIVFGMNTDGSPIDQGKDKYPNEKVEKHEHQNSGNGDSSLSLNQNSNASSTRVVSPSILEPVVEHSEWDNDVFTSSVESTHSTTSETTTAHKQEERRPHSNSLTKESSGSEIVFYPNLETSLDLEERIKEFIISLYYVLEGKRLDRSFERNDKLVLLCAPFEKKDYVGVDTDTK